MTAADTSPDGTEAVPGEHRAPFYRGPGRGDGVLRRSLAWQEQRRIALTRDCPLEVTVPAPRGWGGDPTQVLRCGALVGELCRDPRTGFDLERQAAHSIRIYPPQPYSSEEPTT